MQTTVACLCSRTLHSLLLAQTSMRTHTHPTISPSSARPFSVVLHRGAHNISAHPKQRLLRKRKRAAMILMWWKNTKKQVQRRVWKIHYHMQQKRRNFGISKRLFTKPQLSLEYIRYPWGTSACIKFGPVNTPITMSMTLFTHTYHFMLHLAMCLSNLRRRGMDTLQYVVGNRSMENTTRRPFR